MSNEQEKQALVTSLRLLTASPKSRRALELKLEERGFHQEIVKKILSRLEKEGFLNDRAYAQSLLQSFSVAKPSGRKRIAYELEKRGVENHLIQEVLERYGPEEEREKAFELARQRRDRWQRFDRMKRRKKIYNFLVRRGFDFSLSRQVVAEVERETSA